MFASPALFGDDSDLETTVSCDALNMMIASLKRHNQITTPETQELFSSFQVRDPVDIELRCKKR